MKQIIFTAILIFTFCIAIFAQANNNPCPAISVTSPPDITLPFIFEAKVSKEAENFKVEYIWTAEGGSIIEGQNTKTVKIIPEQCNNIKAIFTIEGLPENCLKTVFEVAAISDGCFIEDKISSIPTHLLAKADEIVMFDEFQNLNAKDEKLRFDNLFRKIKEDHSLKALIILKFDNNSPRKKKIKKLQSIAKYLDDRKVDKSRFNFVIFDNEREETIFYVEPLEVDSRELLSTDEKNHKIINAVNLDQEIKSLFPKK